MITELISTQNCRNQGSHNNFLLLDRRIRSRIRTNNCGFGSGRPNYLRIQVHNTDITHVPCTRMCGRTAWASGVWRCWRDTRTTLRRTCSSATGRLTGPWSRPPARTGMFTSGRSPPGWLIKCIFRWLIFAFDSRSLTFFTNPCPLTTTDQWPEIPKFNLI